MTKRALALSGRSNYCSYTALFSTGWMRSSTTPVQGPPLLHSSAPPASPPFLHPSSTFLSVWQSRSGGDEEEEESQLHSEYPLPDGVKAQQTAPTCCHVSFAGIQNRQRRRIQALVRRRQRGRDKLPSDIEIDALSWGASCKAFSSTVPRHPISDLTGIQQPYILDLKWRAGQLSVVPCLCHMSLCATC